MKPDYRLRREKLLTCLDRENIPYALITFPTDVYYFTGFHTDPHERFMALALDVRRNREWLFVPALDADAAEERGDIAGVVPIQDTDNPMDVLRAEMGEITGTLGIEKSSISYARAEQLMNACPDSSFRDLEPFILPMRSFKTEAEIAEVRRAVEAVEKVMEMAARTASEGMAELELTAEIEYQMRKAGGDKPAFESIVLAGPRSALPHGKPGSYRIRPGDFVLIDIGVQAGGYCSDITRTFVMKEASAEQEAMYETVLAANREAIGAIASGEPIGTLDRAAREVILGKGYGQYFTHRVGHGFGLDIHEPPSIHGRAEIPIAPGMLFTIEPGIYIPGIGGVRIEDDVYIREDGSAEMLTSYPRDIRRL